MSSSKPGTFDDTDCGVSYMETHRIFTAIAAATGRVAPPRDRPVVCMQGLGFVGAAMAIAVARACDTNGDPWFNVIGVELSSVEGRRRVAALNNGHFPFPTADRKLDDAFREVQMQGNFIATINAGAFAAATIVIVSVSLDVLERDGKPVVTFDGFRNAVRTLGERVPVGTLIILETTVPPGTCERVVVPEIATALRSRGLPPDAILIAHSPERVMPGETYFDSIVNFWRVYAGVTSAAADACAAFLSKVVDTHTYPLRRLQSTTATEMLKVLENSYRAVNIAFIEEWSRFAEAANVDLFEVIDAIRQRPTHANIRQPGFGVGGYCLPKDPLLGVYSAQEWHGLPPGSFPFSSQAVVINRSMPFMALAKVEAILGTLQNKTILLLGVSYRPDVGDSRYSPSEFFVRRALERKARVICHDPLLTFWPELAMKLPGTLPQPTNADCVVFALPHKQYATINVQQWLNCATPAIVDANNVLSEAQRRSFRNAGCTVVSVGRGTECL